MDNLEEMYKFLEKYDFPKLNQEELENTSRQMKTMCFLKTMYYFTINFQMKTKGYLM